MKRQGHYFRIRDKIFFCILALIVPVICVVDIGVYTTYRDDLETQIYQLAEQVDSHMAMNLRNSMKTLEENILYKIMASDIFGYQKQLYGASAYSIERKMVNFSALLESMRLSVRSIYIYDQWGCTFFCDEDNVSHEGYDEFKETEAFQYIRGNVKELQEKIGKTIWRTFGDKQDSVYMIKNVVDIGTLEYHGILCVEVENTYFADLVSNAAQEIAVFDENGAVLYVHDTLRTVAQDYRTGVDLSDQYLITSEIVPVKKWTIVNFTSKSRVLSQMNAFFHNLVLSEVVFLFFAIVLAGHISGNITYNTSLLVESFRRINRGERPEPVKYRSHDETAYLCEKFNEMNRELERSIEQMTLDSVQREKAEYNALLAQMNPHFLYNTLEAISSMAKLKGQQEIVESIGRLSRLLRASITTSAQEISLKEELDYVEKYLELQKLVTGGRINWAVIEVGEAAECLVPKLFLQPLVENSIIHGVSDMLDDAMIVIRAARTEDGLLVEVSDNGQGMDEGKIAALLSETDTDEQDRDRAHIGVKSIQRRIQILYGTEYGLAIKSSEEGTVVSARMPVNVQEKVR